MRPKFRQNTRAATCSLAVTWLLAGTAGVSGAAAPEPVPSAGARDSPVMQAATRDRQPAQALAAVSSAPCIDGMADIYPCNNVDLLAFMPLAELGGTFSDSASSDIWGWTDPLTGKEYALLGLVNGTSFVDISDPENPIYLGTLPPGGDDHTDAVILHDEEQGSIWRDIKVYANHAYVVSEAPDQGMQVFDLTELRDVLAPPVIFAGTHHYHGIGNAHNIAINEDTGFAYVVGAQSCSGGLHMIDISTPDSPVFSGCFSADGYTHDTQCVIYNGLDVSYQGAEVCFNSNEDTLTIVDVTNKEAPVQISRNAYPGSGYTHQGWLTPDHRYFLLGDELDELNLRHNTRTRIWDVSDLANPAIVGVYDNPMTAAIDHNIYIKGHFAFEANYRAGLSILDISNPLAPEEVASFDVYPGSDAAGFNGAWSNYPYFDSGVVIVSGIEQGLFVLRPNLAIEDADGDGLTDDADNCVQVFNPSQADSNGDGIGNSCDADTNNDCLVNFLDLGLLKAVFFSADADHDLTGGGPMLTEPDGRVNFLDLGFMKSTFFQNYRNENPSGIANACDGSQ